MKKVFEIPQLVWKVVGQLAIQLTRKDVRGKGIFQNDKKFKYKSEQYKRYKRRGMTKLGRGKNKIGKGEKLEAYKNLSISSKKTRYVDFTLTGAALNNMFIV
ncbi:MAG: hypothetical protein ACK4ND_19825, partial [Cytophagaceae bacterium]